METGSCECRSSGLECRATTVSVSQTSGATSLEALLLGVAVRLVGVSSCVWVSCAL